LLHAGNDTFQLHASLHKRLDVYVIICAVRVAARRLPSFGYSNRGAKTMTARSDSRLL